MAQRREESGDTGARSGVRKAYDFPRLREFGPVGALTQGGTNMGAENSAMMGPIIPMQ